MSDQASRVAAILAYPENKICADCGASGPTWTVLNFQVIICSQCSGVHRSLGTHISKVRSLTIDNLTSEFLSELEATNNKVRNEELEFHVPAEFRKPLPDSTRETRDVYIKAKYGSRAFDRNKPMGIAGDKPASSPVSSDKNTEMKSPRDSSGIAMIEFAGIVCLHILGARNLPAADVGGKSDPYVEVSNGYQTVKTNFLKENLDPFWDEELQMNVQNLKNPLKLTILDKDVVGKDDILGSVDVPLTELASLPKDCWIDKKIVLDKGKKTYVKLRMKFINLT